MELICDANSVLKIQRLRVFPEINQQTRLWRGFTGTTFYLYPLKNIYSVLKLLTVFCGLSRVKRTFFLGTRWRSWNFFACHKQKLCNDSTPLMIRGKAWFLELGEPNLLRFARNYFHPIVLDLNIWNSMTKDMNQICLQAKNRLLWFKNKDGLDRLAN